MKVQLVFELPQEQEEYDYAINGINYSSVLWDFDQYLRSKIKYESEKLSEETLSVYEDLRDKLHEIMQAHDVNLG